MKPVNLVNIFVAVLNFIPDMKVVSAWTMVMPVVFVLFVSFVRELLEEIGRRRADIKTNSQKYNVCNDMSL